MFFFLFPLQTPFDSQALGSLFLHLPCQAPTIFLPQHAVYSSLHRWPIFGVFVSVLVWVWAFVFVFRLDFAWVLGLVCISGLCFERGFRPLSTFQAGCSRSVGFDMGCSYFCAFSGFSDLVFAYISALFFVLLRCFLIGFGHSGGVAARRWFQWLWCWLWSCSRVDRPRTLWYFS